MRKRGAAKTAPDSVLQSATNGRGKFVFHNGDVYNGEYKLHYKQYLLAKQGTGVYTTDNFDVYDGEWDNDAYADSEIHIRYNNDAEYRGGIDSSGGMNGPGTYVFPDGSSIQADWLDNKPFANIVYREPLGFPWTVEDAAENTISFSPGNHFWNDMFSDDSITDSMDSLNEGELNCNNA